MLLFIDNIFRFTQVIMPSFVDILILLLKDLSGRADRLQEQQLLRSAATMPRLRVYVAPDTSQLSALSLRHAILQMQSGLQGMINRYSELPLTGS